MRVTVKKWGNSAAVRLPASVMQATQLEVDEVVEVREDRGRILIERVRPGRYELSELLKGITNKNQHRVIDFGPAVDQIRSLDWRVRKATCKGGGSGRRAGGCALRFRAHWIG